MFTWLLDFSLKNRMIVILLGAISMFYGAYTLSKMPVDVFPDLNKPTVTIMTEAGGMASEEVEQLITFPLETAMNGLPGVEAIRSVSSAGLSFIYVTFDWTVDIYRARQMVSERLSSMEGAIPDGIVSRMGPISSIMGEIMQIAIPIDESKISSMQVREYADWVLRPRLMAIPGVAQVIPIGGQVRQFQVQPNTRRMAELGLSILQIEDALRGYSANTSGGFLESNNREYLIRHIGRTSSLEDLKNIAVSNRNGQTILLRQVADITFAPAVKRGDAGYEGGPAVILGVQKQPSADTVALTKKIESAIAELKQGLPTGMEAPKVTFRQASFIDASISTLEGKLIGASIFVAVVLYFFLGTIRPVLISLTAIPVSILLTALVFKYFGLSINTMTLGGLAIGIGGLVDDAVVDVENVIRRLRVNLDKASLDQLSPLAIVRAASLEVRTGIIYATAIIVLVFIPLFALPGIEGRLFVPLGIAFIVSTLASLLVSVTITPVLCFYLLPSMQSLRDHDTKIVTWLKSHYEVQLSRLLAAPKKPLMYAFASVIVAAASVPFMASAFLPPFNEGTLLIGLRLNPGVSLSESAGVASQAEKLVRQVPEVTYVGRRSGRAELDEHAEGVHVSELDVGLKPAGDLDRSMAEIQADIRSRLVNLPAAIAIGQPISHRIDHMLSGVRSQIAIKIFGDDLDVLRSQADLLRSKLAGIEGLVDLEIEKQVLAPQIKVRIDYDKAAQYGVSTSQIMATLQGMVEGERLSQIIEGNRRFALVIKLPDSARNLEGLADILIDTPNGKIPLSKIASIEDGDGPNQISRDGGKRRIVLSANASKRALSDIVADIRTVISNQTLPEGYFITLDGQFKAQEEASKVIGLLSIGSFLLMFAVLNNRYKSMRLSLMIMSNIPLAMVGAVIGLWISGQPLSIAALIGFITLAGISVRNGILKISHYLNLMQSEGESFSLAMIIRGSIERLSPVLMTALVTAFALAPLLFEAERPGTEILHPVAVVIFSGLISSTLLDTFLTPAMFWLYGKKASEIALSNMKTNEVF
ncbi:MAG: efflux RND transporter permease subunit [Polynucleobacter sp.]|jgi:HME family heavy-metal exporter|uniref:efflux RND transporter permease subunit n=1 Tax=unclassified Polynucleobacter TaxID=2640945 RepID=UPI0002B835E8|nr:MULTISPECIES: efflux RND transporter permease subunit [unclassified Polynucleobacter]AGG34238.1 CzcA family heavy metal efflux protein [beta proteobacterium CB]MBU3545872.1 CusA/CzcA family heavy metal efflux RND transporter [Polynucleobacter sp. MWH-Jannik1A5]MBU3565226.1 CusA/CzcA family heavy metal efflux RND transporter [Polynucleobacter sp. MWH-HuK1]MBU3587542.1 CusA/CzcA family heavy metal efflux RND transporter [Polynucleobacter sp. 31A-FELB]MBU3592376.1 CusA/CzcA family heavy metal 